MSDDSKLKLYTLDELKKNNGKNGNPLWILADGKIFDITGYNHPGGLEVFEQNPDNYKDIYETFIEQGHSTLAERILKTFICGKLKE